MKKVLVGLIGLVAMLVVGGVFMGAAAADAGGKATGREGGAFADRPFGRLIRAEVGRWITLRAELDLTAEQKAQIGGILRGHKEEILGAIKPVVEKRRALADAVAAEPTDEGKIRAAADDLGKAIGDAAVVAAKIKQEVAGVLTAEQKEKIAAFRKASDKAVDEFFEKMEGGEK